MNTEMGDKVALLYGCRLVELEGPGPQSHRAWVQSLAAMKPLVSDLGLWGSGFLIWKVGTVTSTSQARIIGVIYKKC